MDSRDFQKLIDDLDTGNLTNPDKMEEITNIILELFKTDNLDNEGQLKVLLSELKTASFNSGSEWKTKEVFKFLRNSS